MGADITFIKGSKQFYFRDSYNTGNLAWIIDLSYWLTENKKEKYIEFFNKLANITDQQIESHVNYLFSNKKKYLIGKKAIKEDWIKAFKKDRDSIKNNLDLINSCDSVEWSV